MSQQDELQKLMVDYVRRLQKLKERKAVQGISTPPHVLIEIEDIEAEIANLRLELENLKETRGEALRAKNVIKDQVIRAAMLTWEIGRHGSGLGIKIGGLGNVVEELPIALVKAAARKNINLDIETLTPCYPYYSKHKMTKVDYRPSVTMDGRTFEFEIFEYVFPNDGQKVVYFWDDLELAPMNSGVVYPQDPEAAFRIFASVSQAMASYIEQQEFNIVHIQDYHFGLVPFYLSPDYLQRAFLVFTIHNAAAQSIVSTATGPTLLNQVNLSGQDLFSEYFNFNGNLNFLQAGLLKVDEVKGRITTVSGDLAGTWGYAAELKQSRAQIEAKAQAQKKGERPQEVFVPNNGLTVFETLPIAGITNGLGDRNRPENLPELKAKVLMERQAKLEPLNTIFRNPVTQTEMFDHDHNFDLKHLHIKAELKRLLHLEAFNQEPPQDLILLTAIGRLLAQKNMGLVADIIQQTLDYDSGTKFIVLASAFNVANVAVTDKEKLTAMATANPDRVSYKGTASEAMARLILAGGDFCLIPSQIEPCGLVDYEASLLGNIVIGHLTGGVAKVRSCAYLYEWLDIGDQDGEANAFFEKIKEAIDTLRHHPVAHNRLMHMAMKLDTSWDKSADQYLELYLTGLREKNLMDAQTDVGPTSPGQHRRLSGSG